jgi:hypothetical protein
MAQGRKTPKQSKSKPKERINVREGRRLKASPRAKARRKGRSNSRPRASGNAQGTEILKARQGSMQRQDKGKTKSRGKGRHKAGKA